MLLHYDITYYLTIHVSANSVIESGYDLVSSYFTLIFLVSSLNYDKVNHV